MKTKDTYDYNKPQTSWITKKPIDNTIIVAEDWWLKPMLTASTVMCHEVGSPGRYISDFKSVGRDVRVIGTRLQNYNLFCKMLDEHGWQLKDSWDAEVKPKHLKMYKENDNKPIIINLI